MHAPAIITSEKMRTPGDRAMAGVHAGRKMGMTSGSHVADLAAVQKAITLCIGGCDRKFNAKGVGYITKPNIPQCFAQCDGCRQHRMPCRLFVPATQNLLTGAR
jgi:hypothetical protein